MNLLGEVKYIINEQDNKGAKIPVDVILCNGNIFLRSFHIIGLDEKHGVVKGLTQQEEYSYLREKRDPVFCHLRLQDIKEIFSYDLQVGTAV